jgi:hypothetical protein
MIAKVQVELRLAAVAVVVRAVRTRTLPMTLSTYVNRQVVLPPLMVKTFASCFSACCVPHAAAIPAAKTQRSARSVVKGRTR